MRSFENRVTNKEHRHQPDKRPRREQSHTHSSGMSSDEVARLWAEPLTSSRAAADAPKHGTYSSKKFAYIPKQRGQDRVEAIWRNRVDDQRARRRVVLWRKRDRESAAVRLADDVLTFRRFAARAEAAGRLLLPSLVADDVSTFRGEGAGSAPFAADPNSPFRLTLP